MKQQKGFTLVEVLLAIIAISVTIGVGVFAYSRISDSNDSKNAVRNESKKSQTDDTSYIFQPEDKKYKIALPDGWRFVYTPASEENENTSYLYAQTSEMKSAPGVTAQVRVETGGYGQETGFTLSVHENPGPVGFGEGLKSEGSFKTLQGKTVDAFIDEEATEPFSEPAEGSGNFFTRYEYYLVGSNNTVYKFTYDIAAGDTSEKEAVEKTIKSIQLP